MKQLQSVRSGGRLLALALILSSLGSADTILFQRALPTGPNVNASGANRSNVDWINPSDKSSNYFVNGDDFSVPLGQTWQISSIAVFIVMNKVGDIPADEFSNFALYLAPDTGDQQPQNFQLASTSAVGTASPYVGGTSPCTTGYLAADQSTCLPVFKITFSVNLSLGPGKYDFAADGTLKSITGCTGTCGWYNLASNAALSGGSTEDGADGLYLNWYAGTPQHPNLADALPDLNNGYVTFNSAGTIQDGPCGSPSADVCGGVGSSTDMNVIITGNSVPEPGTISMFGLSGLVLAIAAVRRRLTTH